MRSLLVFLIACSTLQAAAAECVYFRTSASLLKCAEAEAETANAGNPYAVRPGDLELDGPGTQAFARVTCECQYSLMGSNVLCDIDQTIERSSVMGADKPAEACLRGRALCKDVCPQRLP